MAELTRKPLELRKIQVTDSPRLEAVVALYKERVATIVELADEAQVFYTDVQPTQELLDAHLTAEVLPALRDLAERFAEIAWEASTIGASIGNARETQSEDAEAGDADARNSGRADTYAVCRCSIGVVSSGYGAGAHEEVYFVTSCLIFLTRQRRLSSTWWTRRDVVGSR